MPALRKPRPRSDLDDPPQLPLAESGPHLPGSLGRPLVQDVGRRAQEFLLAIALRSGSGGVRGVTYASSSPRESRQATIPGLPKRSATAGSGSAASSQAVRTPSISSVEAVAGSSGSLSTGICARNAAAAPSSTRGRP